MMKAGVRWFKVLTLFRKIETKRYAPLLEIKMRYLRVRARCGIVEAPQCFGDYSAVWWLRVKTGTLEVMLDNIAAEENEALKAKFAKP